jgi:hypothetical protein
VAVFLFKGEDKFLATFCCVCFDIKMGWAKFWAIFSQTHLVTLAASHFKGFQ